jgi:hypothetical protein
MIGARSTRCVQLSAAALPPEWPDTAPGSRLGTGLSAWAAGCPLPLVLFFDEIDSLRGETLMSVLRQLRKGHNARPDSHPFPASVVLCGLRDIRDHKAASGGDPTRLGTASPFNIAVKSLRIGDFTHDQLDRYLDRLSLDTGTLVIFDRRPEAPPWPERTTLSTTLTPTGRRVTLLRA